MSNVSSRQQRVVIVDGSRKVSIDLRKSDYIDSGAVGSVYHLSDHGYAGSCAKIYFKPDDTLQEKLIAMMQRPPARVINKHRNKSFVQFAWPTHLIQNTKGKVVGFVMPEIDFKKTKSLVTYTERRESATFLTAEQRSLPRRVSIAANMAALMADLHAQGHAFVDFKDSNVRIYPDDGLVGFVDTDGFRIEGSQGKIFSGLYTTPTFNSPESIRGDKKKLGEYHDRFVLAILLFRILNGGIHPFQGVPKQQLAAGESFDLDKHIEAHLYAYGAHPSSSLAPTPGSIHEFWDSKTLAMFERTFTVQSPRDRVSAMDWVRHFRELEKNGFARCKAYPNDIEHVYFPGNRCPICSGFSVTHHKSNTHSRAASLNQGNSNHSKPTSQHFSAPNTISKAATSQSFGSLPTPLPSGKKKSSLKIFLLALFFIASIAFVKTSFFSKERYPNSNGTISSGQSNTATIEKESRTDSPPIKSTESSESTASSMKSNGGTSPQSMESGVVATDKSMMMAAFQGNLRSNPDTKSEVNAVVFRGEKLQIDDSHVINDFVKATTQKGDTGWVGMNLLVPYSDGQKLLNKDDPVSYLENNEKKLDDILNYAKSDFSTIPSGMIRDTSSSKWFRLNSKIEKNQNKLKHAFASMLAATIADPLDSDNWIELGYRAYDIQKFKTLKASANYSIALDKGSTNSYTLVGLSLALESTSDNDSKNKALKSFKLALDLSKNRSYTEKFLRLLASKDTTNAIKPIVEEAIAK